MEYENNDKKIESVFSSKIRAGKRRTYFFDVRATKGNDYFLTIQKAENVLMTMDMIVLKFSCTKKILINF